VESAIYWFMNWTLGLVSLLLELRRVVAVEVDLRGLEG